MKIASGVVHDVPDDMEKALTANEQILAKWNRLTPIQRNEWICWVTIVKKTETRLEHIVRMVEELTEGEASALLLAWLPASQTVGKKMVSKK